MIDPPREEVKPALEKARRAGIRTVMITGDYPNTARAIAESIGLLRPGRKVATGADLDAHERRRSCSGEIEQTDVFARVSPEHKLRIVDALQAKRRSGGHDRRRRQRRPAIKRADIGVAMGITGTDVAKGTADMVLTDDNYASIVAAVEQGRIIYANIRKFVFFLLSVQRGRDHDHLPRHAGRPAAAADRHPAAVAQPDHRRRAGPGAGHGKGRPRHHDAQAARQATSRSSIGTMGIGILVQTVAQTGAVLLAFALGTVLAPGGRRVAAAGVNPLALLAPVRLARRRCADGRDDGICHALAVRALPGVHGALRVCLGLPDRRLLEPLHAVGCGAFRSSCCCWCARCRSCSRSSTRISCRLRSGASCLACRWCRRSPRRSPSSSCAWRELSRRIAFRSCKSTIALRQCALDAPDAGLSVPCVSGTDGRGLAGGSPTGPGA